jgi:hypothetical protein
MKQITWKYCSLLAGAFLMLTVSSAQAQFALNTSIPSSPVDTFDWSTLGTTYTDITTPASITAIGGLTATVDNGGGLSQRLDEGSGWSGNFANGAPLLWNQDNQNNITLTFSSPVTGAGAQIQADDFGSFTAEISLYGASNNLLTSFTENGVSTDNNDNSAIFIGARSTTGAADIYAISFSTPVSEGDNNFAIGNVLVGVPEPASSYAGWAGILACGLVALHRSFRKKELQS